MIYANILNLMHLAQTAPAAPAGNGATNPGTNGSTMLVFTVGFVLIFYFLIIRPQNLKQKQQLNLINSVKTGDKVITAGGIHGMISNVKESTVIVKVADNVKIEVDKAGITTVIKRSEAEEPVAS